MNLSEVTKFITHNSIVYFQPGGNKPKMGMDRDVVENQLIPMVELLSKASERERIVKIIHQRIKIVNSRCINPSDIHALSQDQDECISLQRLINIINSPELPNKEGE